MVLWQATTTCAHRCTWPRATGERPVVLVVLVVQVVLPVQAEPSAHAIPGTDMVRRLAVLEYLLTLDPPMQLNPFDRFGGHAPY
eukprot:3320873-Rhodomonas_salina.4